MNTEHVQQDASKKSPTAAITSALIKELHLKWIFFSFFSQLSCGA